MEEATLASLSLTHVRYVGPFDPAGTHAYLVAESQRPYLLRIGMAGAGAARLVRCVRHVDMGFERGRGAPHVHRPDGL